VTKLDTILETTNFFLVSKLVYIIVKWFLNWYLISNQGYATKPWLLIRYQFRNYLTIIETNLETIFFSL